MMAKWTGPYRVAEDLGKGLFRLKNQKTGRVMKKAVNAVRLKQYHMPANTDDTALINPGVTTSLPEQTSDSHPDPTVSKQYIYEESTGY